MSKTAKRNVPLSAITPGKDISEELQFIEYEGVGALRVRWQTLFALAPPDAFGADLLRRSIAQHIQECAYGRLEAAAARELKSLIGQLSRKSPARPICQRRLSAGTTMLRQWKGVDHRVTASDV